MCVYGGTSHVLVGVDGIKQHHPGYLVREEVGKDSDEEATHGVTDEHVWRRDAGVHKDAAQPTRGFPEELVWNHAPPICRWRDQEPDGLEIGSAPNFPDN